jgi:hypothetical protein
MRRNLNPFELKGADMGEDFIMGHVMKIAPPDGVFNREANDLMAEILKTPRSLAR